MFTKKIVNLVASKSVVGSNLQLLQKVVLVSLGGTNLGKDEQKTVTKSDVAGISASGDAKLVLDAYFSSTEKPITILEMAAVSTTPETVPEKITRLVKMLTEEETLSGYLIIMPKEFFSEVTITNVLTPFNDVNKHTYFVFPLAYGSNVASDANLQRVKGMKSCIVVYEQLQSASYSALGLFAATYLNAFEISLTNTMRAFEYIFINQQIKDVTKSTSDLLDKNLVTYFANIIGKPGYLNVKCQDGEEFAYYIAYDNMSIRVTDSVTNTLVNANNKFNSAITYDDIGITTLKAVIENELTNCLDLKLITEFGGSYDQGEQKITDINEISSIPFQKYIASNPNDYKIGAYNGFSFECRISKFILTININANLY